MFELKTVAILATGASLTQQQVSAVHRAHRLGKLAAVAVNDAFRLAPWADALYAADAAWWKVNADDALAFAGAKFTADQMTPYRAVTRLKQTGLTGYDPEPGCVRTGGNSGYQALHLVIQGGAERVLLLGYDMGGPHYFGAHKPPLRNTTHDTFVKWRERFAALEGRGATIINCTPGSALACFPRGELEAELC